MIVLGIYQQLLVVTGSYQQLSVVACSCRQLLVVIYLFILFYFICHTNYKKYRKRRRRRKKRSGEELVSYWHLVFVFGSYQQLLVFTGSFWQLLVVAGSTSNSNSNKLLYFHGRVILQYCKSMHMTSKIQNKQH